MFFTAVIMYNGVKIEVPCTTVQQAKRVAMNSIKERADNLIRVKIVNPAGEVIFKMDSISFNEVA